MTTGSHLEYDEEQPPVFPLRYVTMQDGQPVLIQTDVYELPDLIREFLESFK